MGYGRDTDTNYVTHYRLAETSTHKDLDVDLNFIYLWLNRFKKNAEQAKGNPVDMFLYSLKHIAGADKMPECFKDSPEITNFFNTALLINLPIEVRHELEINENMTTRNDILVAMDEAEARGEAKKASSIAGNMKNQGIDIKTIAACTGLSVAEIEKM